MVIDNKFEFEDKVYAIYARQVREKKCDCPICNGDKKVIVNNESFRCPKCFGHGVLNGKLIIQWQLLNGISYAIKSLHYTVQGNIRYGISTNISFKEEDAFLTKKEAIAECKRRNKEIENDNF